MLTSPDFVLACCGLPASARAQVSALLGPADLAVKRWLQRDIEQQTYTQYYSGNNTQRLTLKQRPVTDVAGVWLDSSGYFGHRAGGFDATLSQLADGYDYVLDWDTTGTQSDSGILFRVGTVWPMIARVNTLNRLNPDQGPAFGNVKVTYTAGYATIPQDLQYAVAELVAYMRLTAQYGGMTLAGETLGTYAYKLLMIPKYQSQIGSVLEILGQYREIGW